VIEHADEVFSNPDLISQNKYALGDVFHVCFIDVIRIAARMLSSRLAVGFFQKEGFPHIDIARRD